MLCLGGLLVSLRGITECDLKTFYSSSAPSFHPSTSLSCFCSLSLSPFFLTPVFSPPAISRSPEGGLSMLWLVLLAVVHLRRMPAWLSLDKDGSAHNIRQSSSLFHLIKKTTFDENRNILRCQRDSWWLIYLLTVFIWRLAVGICQESRRYCHCHWISVCIFYQKNTSSPGPHSHVYFSSQSVSATEQWMNKQPLGLEIVCMP